MKVVADPSLLWCATDRGAYLETARGAWELPGAAVSRWLDLLVPLLDGGRELADLTRGLPEDRAKTLSGLVDWMVKRDIARECNGAFADPVELWLGVQQDERAPGRPVLLVGDHPIADAVAAATRRAGFALVPGGAAGGAHPASGELVIAVDTSGDEAAHAGVFATAEAVWISPPAADGRATWSEIARRAAALGEHQVLTKEVPALVATAASARLVRELALFASGTTSSDDRHVLRMDVSSLHVTRHFCPVRRHGRTSSESTPAWLRPPITLDEFSQRITRLCDDRLGVLSTVSEGALRQLPLHASSVRVSNPVSSRPATVLGLGPDFAAARFRAVATALARYCTILNDAKLQEPWHGVDAVTGAPVEVDPGTFAGDPPRAVSVGLSWSDAVLGALWQLTARLAARDDAVLSWRCVAATSDVTRLHLNQLALMSSREVVVADRRGVPGTATVTARSDTDVVTTSRDTSAEAERAAIELLLARRQAGPVDPVPAGPELLGQPLRPGEAVKQVAMIAAGLRAQGLRVVAVPFTDDEALSAEIPFLLQVVLIDD